MLIVEDGKGMVCDVWLSKGRMNPISSALLQIRSRVCFAGQAVEAAQAMMRLKDKTGPVWRDVEIDNIWQGCYPIHSFSESPHPAQASHGCIRGGEGIRFTDQRLECRASAVERGHLWKEEAL